MSGSSERGSPGRLALAIFALAVLVRLALWLALGESRPVGDDQADYLAIRDGLLDGRGLIDPRSGLPSAYRDPLYPFFLAALALVGLGSAAAVWSAQILLSAATGALLVLAAARAGGMAAARATGALFLLHASYAGYAFLAYAETLTGFFAALLLLALARWEPASRWTAQAAVGVSAALVSATRLAGAPAAALAILVRARRSPRPLARWILVPLVALVCLLPWVARNARVVGSPAWNTNGPVNFYLGNNPHAPLVHSYRAMTDSLVWRPLVPLPEADRARAALRLGFAYVTSRPREALQRALYRVPDTVEFDRLLLGVARRGQFPRRPPIVVLAAAGLCALLTAAPMLLGLATALSPGRTWIAHAGRWFFLAQVAVQVVTIAHPRLTLTAWLLLLPGSALLVDRLRRRERGAVVAVVVAGGLLALVWVREVRLG